MMKRLFLLLAFACVLWAGLPASAQTAGHLSVDGIALGRPFDDVVRDFRARGFRTKTQTSDGELLIGRFFGQPSVATMPLRSGDSCHMVMMVLPEPATSRQLYSLYHSVRARITELYDVYGREQNLYIDQRLDDFSPIDDRIAAVRYEQAVLYTEFQTPVGSIDVSINRHEATGLGIFVIFRDRDYVEPADTAQSSGVVVAENQALCPTSLLGVGLAQPVADVIAGLQAAGLSNQMTWMERQFYQKHHITRLRGTYFGQPGCDVTVRGTGLSASVTGCPELVSISFPAMHSWRSLYTLYTSLREALAVRYGSIYRCDDAVAGQTSQLLDLLDAQALQALRTGQVHLETLLLNAYDNYVLKVGIAYAPHDASYRVTLVCYSPEAYAQRVSVSAE